MVGCSQYSWLLSLVAALVLASSISYSQAFLGNDQNKVKSGVFLSPLFYMEPGSVTFKYFYNVDFPRGHIALKSFSAEIVDDAGTPIPLHEVYLHHTYIARYYQNRAAQIPDIIESPALPTPADGFIFLRNQGPCQTDVLGQYFGLGSEIRGTSTNVPDPYGIEIGNPDEVPEGYVERWFLNVHTIDTRGAEDPMACTECRRDVFNTTMDEYGQPLKPDYKGGLSCCHGKSQCRLRPGFKAARKGLHLKYKLTWIDWESFIIPVSVYILDVTDSQKWVSDSTGLRSVQHDCVIEYNVESQSSSGVAYEGCIDTKRTKITLAKGGYVIFGIAHSHAASTGSTVYGEDGRVICTSYPIYGQGQEAGNEAGYVVAMTTCYPEFGSVKINDGETLIHESNYTCAQIHTGVMGLFYLLVADRVPAAEPVLSLRAPLRMLEHMNLSTFDWPVALFGVAAALVGAAVTIAVVRFGLRYKREDGYSPLMK